jgi:hypothetical protein
MQVLNEERLARSASSQFGVHYTPSWLASHITSVAVDEFRRFHSRDPKTIADLSAGSGIFLRQAASITRDAELIGLDLNHKGLAIAYEFLGKRAKLRVADGLGELLAVQRITGPELDLVLGNPPFKSPRTNTSGLDPSYFSQLKQRFGRAVSPTTDISTLFVLRALELLAVGGIGALILPASFLGSDGAAFVRSLLHANASIFKVEQLPKSSFQANVDTISLWFRRNSTTIAEPKDLVNLSHYLSNAPEIKYNNQLTVGDVASVVALFRDEYYWIASNVIDGTGSNPDSLRVVTTGLINPLKFNWGTRFARLAGRRYLQPVIPTLRMAEAPKPLRQTQVPKIILAPQKPVPTFAVDQDGSFVPVTPLISIIPKADWSLRELATVLWNPISASWFHRRRAGTGIGTSVIRIKAQDVRELPLPIHRPPALDDEIIAANPDLYLKQVEVAYGTTIEQGARNWWLSMIRIPCPTVTQPGNTSTT